MLLTDIGIRAADPADHPAVTAVLVDAFADGAVAGWAQPHPDTRAAQLRGYFTLLVAHAATDGIIRVAHTAAGITGVAVWYPRPPAAAGIDVHDLTPRTDPTGGGAGDGVAAAGGRLAALEQALKARHPTTLHQYLAYLAVRRTGRTAASAPPC